MLAKYYNVGLLSKLNGFILHAIVAEGHARGRSVLRHGFSLRFALSNEYMEISYKLRNLKVAVTP